MYYLCFSSEKYKKTMAIYSFRIVGVHYAVNPDSNSHAEETELMHQRTAQRLRELDEVRPPVVLIPEPSNPADTRAVMARVDGGRIGYVDKTQLDTVHALFQTNGGRPLMAHIESVEAKKHGWMMVQVESKEEVRIEPQNQRGSVWENWTCMLPVLPTIESQFAMMEAEAMLEDALSKSTIEPIERYIRLWLDNALHDLSHEARLTREHYIMRLKELVSQNATADQELSNRISALISAIEKQRTAICGQKRMNLRVDKWWKELLQSKEMEQLWGMWTLHNEGNSEPWGNELDSHLKALPNSLYAFVDRKKLFFSRLYYSHIPRKKYWQIVSLMLLKDRMQVEGGRESRPPVHSEMEGHRESRHPVLGCRPQEQTLDEPFTVVIPPELETPEAKKILARLQKKGLLDKDFQPVGLSQAKRGVLAWELCDHLRIEHCWKVMEVLWKCNGETIRKARERGIDTDTVMEFNKKLKNVIY